MWREGHRPRKEVLQISLNSGGLGDVIAQMPAIKYIHSHFKFVELRVFVFDFLVELVSNLLPGVAVYKFSEIPIRWKNDVPAKQTKGGPHTGLKSHLVDHGFHVIADKMVSIEHKNYCKLTTISTDHYGLPDNYVVVTTGHTTAVREMMPETINSVCDYLIARGITPVFLGSKTQPTGIPGRPLIGHFNGDIDFGKGIDLVGKTTLVEAGSVIAGAMAIVGVDNGLLHLAGCTSVPIVFGTTTVAPEHRLPYRENVLGKNCYVVEPPTSLKCRYCQTNWDFNYADKHQFHSCYYLVRKLDSEIKCVKSISAEKFIKYLEIIL